MIGAGGRATDGALALDLELFLASANWSVQEISAMSDWAELGDPQRAQERPATRSASASSSTHAQKGPSYQNRYLYPPITSADVSFLEIMSLCRPKDGLAAPR